MRVCVLGAATYISDASSSGVVTMYLEWGRLYGPCIWVGSRCLHLCARFSAFWDKFMPSSA